MKGGKELFTKLFPGLSGISRLSDIPRLSSASRLSGGFSYIELLIALALFSIMLVPVIPMLSQALANHEIATQRHEAQGRATALALQVRADFANRNAILQEFENGSDFTYHLSLIEPVSAYFQSPFTHLYGRSIFIVVEVFDEREILKGISVAHVNNH